MVLLREPNFRISTYSLDYKSSVLVFWIINSILEGDDGGGDGGDGRILGQGQARYSNAPRD